MMQISEKILRKVHIFIKKIFKKSFFYQKKIVTLQSNIKSKHTIYAKKAIISSDCTLLHLFGIRPRG
jgi:hypothetical protein